ncbi:MAG: urea ABC transporter ATP-binding subunit UrtE [Alphaproteobacteria bacterium]|nr:urea ABC transporter ATP-binding subunit UrtE [Alphaproteobacteria bacterium]
MLELRNIDLFYGASQVLFDVQLTAERGKITCLMGTNGAGKTSLLKVIAGVHPKRSGRFWFDGREITAPKADQLARGGIGYVPQGRDIFPLLTVQENLETGFACLPRGERRVLDEIFELFPVLKEMRSRRGGDLSGGQQQQLAIGRALVTKPKVLLLDEPTEGIQPSIIKQIGRVISHLKDQGDLAIVLVEQYFDFAHQLGDSFTALRNGRVVLSGDQSRITRDELVAAVSV